MIMEKGLHNDKWKITVVEHGYFLDVGRAQTFYGAHNKPDGGCREDQPANVAIIQGYGHNILVDTGFGNQYFIEKCNAAHMLKPEEYLSAAELKPDNIDTVIVSHMHYDHVGFINYFPLADVYVQKTEYNGWKNALQTHPSFDLLFVYLDENTMADFQRIDASGKLHLIGDGEEIFPGIKAYLTPGHSFGTQSIAVDAKKGPVVICGDSAYAIENIKSMTPMGYGISQLDMMESFEKILKLAEGKFENIVPGHDLSWPDRYTSTKTVKGKRNRITVLTK